MLEMGDGGLREVADPARAFLADHDAPAPGASSRRHSKAAGRCWSRSRRWSRRPGCSTPRADASGVDPNRLALLVAVLGRRAGIGLGGHDVYANLAGGLTVAEPGLDLPIALALASSLRDRPVVAGTVAIGEVGLLGELRPVTGLDRRLREAARLGFARADRARVHAGDPPCGPGDRDRRGRDARDAIGPHERRPERAATAASRPAARLG